MSGKSKWTIKSCECGRKAIRCMAKNGRGMRCKNYPRLCGYCADHCPGSSKNKCAKHEEKVNEKDE
jgi:hypothetical protein